MSKQTLITELKAVLGVSHTNAVAFVDLLSKKYEVHLIFKADMKPEVEDLEETKTPENSSNYLGEDFPKDPLTLEERKAVQAKAVEDHNASGKTFTSESGETFAPVPPEAFDAVATHTTVTTHEVPGDTTITLPEGVQLVKDPEQTIQQ